MNSIFRKYRIMTILGISFVVTGIISSIVLASSNPNFKITINPGALSVDIVADRNNGGLQKFDSISAPIFNFDSISASTECRTGANASQLVLGSDFLTDCDLPCPGGPGTCLCDGSYYSGGYLYVANPDATSGGWTVSLAPTNGADSTWNSSNFDTFLNFNQSDCVYNGGIQLKGNFLGGRMYVNPTSATIVNGKCAGPSCSVNGVTLGSSSYFDYGVNDSITLVQADNNSNSIADYLIHGINVSQTIPAMTPSDSYSMEMTLSVINNNIGSGPQINYNGVNVTGGDIYTDLRDSSNRVYLTSANGSLLNWSIVVGGDGDYVVSPSESASSTVSVFSMGDVGYIKSRDVTVRATNPNDNTTSDIVIHFATGQLCQDGTWISNEDSCPILTEE